MEVKTKAKIRVRLESFDHELLVSSCKKIINILPKPYISTIGTSIALITLPTHKRIYCVLRSPHVDKDSREHFEIRIHKRILEIYYDDSTMNDYIIHSLLYDADLPSGIFYKIICLS